EEQGREGEQLLFQLAARGLSGRSGPGLYNRDLVLGQPVQVKDQPVGEREFAWRSVASIWC
ncbi:MAG: hypothetical protein KJ046_16635, partial [Anaerolineae bacterium]|nr:hypothetical protein [Anaerolineae bacterium]